MGALQGRQAWTEKAALCPMGFLFQVHHLVKRMMEDVTELKLEWRMMTSPAPGAEQGSALMALSSTQWTQRPASGGENLANSLSCPYTAVFRLYRYHNPNVHTGGLNVHKTWLT